MLACKGNLAILRGSLEERSLTRRRFAVEVLLQECFQIPFLQVGVVTEVQPDDLFPAARLIDVRFVP